MWFTQLREVKEGVVDESSVVQLAYGQDSLLLHSTTTTTTTTTTTYITIVIVIIIICSSSVSCGIYYRSYGTGGSILHRSAVMIFIE